MEKRDYSAPFQDLRHEIEKIQNSYLGIACQIEPQIVESLPLKSYIQLTKNQTDLLDTPNAKALFRDNLHSLMSKDEITHSNLIGVFHNAKQPIALNDFCDFREQFYEWIKEYCFEKDWIIQSGLATLEQRREAYMKNEKPLEVLITFGRVSTHERLGGFSEKDMAVQEELSFYREGWTSFEDRVKARMKELKKRYKEMTRIHTFKTKDKDFNEKIKLLALWNIKRWTISEIATKECGIEPALLPDEDDPFERKKPNIYKEIQRLKDYDLPVRKKNSRN